MIPNYRFHRWEAGLEPNVAHCRRGWLGVPLGRERTAFFDRTCKMWLWHDSQAFVGCELDYALNQERREWLERREEVGP